MTMTENSVQLKCCKKKSKVVVAERQNTENQSGRRARNSEGARDCVNVKISRQECK